MDFNKVVRNGHKLTEYANGLNYIKEKWRPMRFLSWTIDYGDLLTNYIIENNSDEIYFW